MTLSSFDIFDTTLIRKCGKPENVVYSLARKLYPKDFRKQDEFTLWRNRVPKEIAKNGEYTLEDVYSSNGVEAFTEYTISELKKLEMSVEEELLFGNPAILQKIRECRAQGDQIVFISDMHLPVDFLRKILKREDAYKEGDGLYVSNDKKARKDKGTLYDLVRNDYHPKKWIHYGDNTLSDFRIPRKKSIKTILINEDYNETELELVNKSPLLQFPSELSMLAGISRAARRKFGNMTETMLAADFVAPAFIPFVMHVLEDAKKRGLKTLYFISRDGFIFQKIAEKMPHEGVNFRYLFASRKSLQGAFFHIATDEELIVTKLKEKKKFNHNYTDEYEICCGYLLQEGVFSDNIGLVDLGWFGSTRLMINSIRKKNGKKPLMCYYYGEDPYMISSFYGEFDVFCTVPLVSEWQCLVMEEYYCACPWSTTLSYKKEGDKYVPVFGKEISYNEDVSVKTNVAVCEYIVPLVLQYGFHLESLYEWMSISLKSLMTGDFFVDWTILSNRYQGNEFQIRKLSLQETISYMLNRKKPNVTNIKASLDLTWGYTIRRRLLCINKITGLLLTYMASAKSKLCFLKLINR